MGATKRPVKFLDTAAWKQAQHDSCAATSAAAPVGLYKTCDHEPALLTKQEANGEDRVLAWTISTEDRDRDQDRITVTGWDLKNFKRNGVVLWAHNYGQPPVARALETVIDREGKRLRSTAQFTPKEMNPFGFMVYELAANKYLRTASVGFLPKEWEPDPELADQEQSGYRRGLLFTKQELLEWSVVPVPSNPMALQSAKSIHGIDLEPYVEWAEMLLDGEKGPGLWIPRKDVEEVIAVVRPPKPTVVISVEKAAPQEKKPISYASAHPDGTANAAKDAEWSGPKEVSAASVDDLKVMCAWVDTENDTSKGAYKLPHHRQKDKALVWRGVVGAMTALLGGRGGVNIPDGDRKGVYNHLAKHYRDFDEEPPEFRHHSALELAIHQAEVEERQLGVSIRAAMSSLDKAAADLLERIDRCGQPDLMRLQAASMELEAALEDLETVAKLSGAFALTLADDDTIEVADPDDDRKDFIEIDLDPELAKLLGAGAGQSAPA